MFGIDFRKTFNQLIKGGIGVVDGFLYLKDSDGNIKSASDIPTLEELPEADASKAGQRFSFNGKDWEHLTEEKIQANNWDLPVGTPWPVQGYMSYQSALSQTGTDTPVEQVVYEKDFDVVINRDDVGAYSISFDVPANSRVVFDSNLLIYKRTQTEEILSLGNISFYLNSPTQIGISIVEDDLFTGVELSAMDILGALVIPLAKVYPPYD